MDKSLSKLGLYSFLICFVFSFSANAAVGNEEETPQQMFQLQQVATYGKAPDTGFGNGEDVALDIRRDAIKEAALSYGARGGLAHRSFEIMESMEDHEEALSQIFRFQSLLIAAPSGLLIEPPIVGETTNALIIEQGGIEAAVSDKIYNINKNAKIVTAPRDWRQYLVMDWGPVDAPPKILWPKNPEEKLEWDMWVQDGWKEGVEQADDIFQANLDRLTNDFSGMVRYRTLLTQGIINAPFAMIEDRGITGGGSEMRIGDRAIRITGPSQLDSSGEIWQPADR